MRHPRLLIPETFRSIHKQPDTEGNHPDVCLRILTPQDTPHYRIHVHHMDFKMHPDREKYLNYTYQCVHANIQTTSTCITIVVKLAFICMHLPFGTNPAPSEYTTISEASIKLGNYLLMEVSWDATNLQSPHIHLLPREDYLPASCPLVKAYQLGVDIEAKEASMDGFINDIITITIDNPYWVEHAKNSS